MRSDDEAPPPGPPTRAVSSPAIPPANGEIARRVRRTLPLTAGAGIDDVLDTHAKLLDALFIPNFWSMTRQVESAQKAKG